MIKFIKNVGLKNWLIIYAVLFSLVIGVVVIVSAAKLGYSDTIVVDASKYIERELKASEQQNKALDLKFNSLYIDMVKTHEEIKILKSHIKDRDKAITTLQKELENDKIDSITVLTNVQHDSLFTTLIEGLD